MEARVAPVAVGLAGAVAGDAGDEADSPRAVVQPLEQVLHLDELRRELRLAILVHPAGAQLRLDPRNAQAAGTATISVAFDRVRLAQASTWHLPSSRELAFSVLSGRSARAGSDKASRAVRRSLFFMAISGRGKETRQRNDSG